jgi:uncharacterized protein
MIALTTALARMVRRGPGLVVAVSVALTAVLAGLATQVEVAVGMEEFAPDNVHLEAAETLGDRFGASGEEVLQVLVSADEGGELIGADGLRSVAAVTTAIEDSDAAVHLAAQGDRPPVVGPFGATLHTLEGQGLALDAVDDETVRRTFLEAQAQLTDEDAATAVMLLPDDADLAEPSADAALLLVFLGTDELPADAVDRLDAVVDIQVEIAAAAQGAEVAEGVSVSAFGFPLLFSDTETFEAELARLFASAFGIIVLILGIVFWVRPGAALRPVGAGRRTVADVLLAMATIVMAITWMNGAAVLLGPGYLGVIGRMTEMTQIIPVLLIGLGVDYAIHLTSRYREEVGAGAGVDDGMLTAMRTVGLALGLATVTTAVGFLTNVFNPLPTLRDFGVLAAIGIAAAFALMLTFVPATRLLLDRRAEGAGRLPASALATTSSRLLPATMARTAVLAERVPAVTLAVTVLVGGALGIWGFTQLETRFSSTDFVAEDHPMLHALETIEERFGGGFGETTEVLLTGDATTPEAHDALVEALEQVGTVEGVATVDGRPMAESPVGLLAMLAAPGPDGEPGDPTVARQAAAENMGEDLRFPAGADVESVYGALVAAAPQQAERVLDVGADGPSHARVGIRTTVGESGAGELLAALDEAFAPVAAAGLGPVVTSNPVINDTIIAALQEAQTASLLITLGAVLALLVMSFWWRSRRPALGVLTTLPVVLALLWTFAMMAATDVPFGPVTSMIAAIAIGIGIPYSIHVTNRFEEDRRRLPPEEAIRSTVRHTGGALAGSALTTCAGFGVLVTSSLVPFQQFGMVTVYAIGFALLASTLVLPSALSLWDRWHRRRAEAATAPVRPEPSTVAGPV